MIEVGTQHSLNFIVKNQLDYSFYRVIKLYVKVLRISPIYRKV